MFKPIVSRWMPACAGELFSTCRTTLLVDDEGRYWLRRQWPMAAAKLPTADAINPKLAEMHLSSCAVNPTASGLDRGAKARTETWKSRAARDYAAAAGVPKMKTSRREAQDNKDLGVVVLSKADRWVDKFIEGKSQEVNRDD